MSSNYEKAVHEAKYCREQGITEEDALPRIQNQIEYDHPVPGNPGSLAKRIWREGA